MCHLCVCEQREELKKQQKLERQKAVQEKRKQEANTDPTKEKQCEKVYVLGKAILSLDQEEYTRNPLCSLANQVITFGKWHLQTTYLPAFHAGLAPWFPS